MTPAIYTHAGAALLAGAIAFTGAWRVQDWRYGAQLASLKASHAETLREIADKTAKASEAVAREIIGHDSASVDRGYVHMDPSSMQAALDKLPDVTSV